MSVSCPSQEARGTKEDTAGSCSPMRVEARKWRMQGTVAKKQGMSGSKDLEEARGAQEARCQYADGRRRRSTGNHAWNDSRS